MMKKMVLVFIIGFFISGCALRSPTIKKENVEEGTKLSEILECQKVACLKAKSCKHIGEDKQRIYYTQKRFKLRKSAIKVVGDTIWDGLGWAGTALFWADGTYVPPASIPSRDVDTGKYYIISVKTGEEGKKIKNIQISR